MNISCKVLSNNQFFSFFVLVTQTKTSSCALHAEIVSWDTSLFLLHILQFHFKFTPVFKCPIKLIAE